MKVKCRLVRTLFGICAVIGVTAFSLCAYAQTGDNEQNGNLLQHAVFTMTDDPAGNAIIAYYRNVDGSLTEAGRFATGGLGSGTLAGNQGGDADQNQDALISRQGFLFVVNAGANPDQGSVSVLRIDKQGLTLTDTATSGGLRPNSLALLGNALYVLNRASGTVSGFRVTPDGKLFPLADSVRPVVGGADSNPSQIQFSPDGATLIAVERETQTIDVFPVNSTGRLSAAQAFPSHGQEPFAFDFDRRGHLIVAEGFFNATGAGAASSYELTPDGGLQLVSGSIANSDDDACWIVATRDGHLVFVQGGGGQISSYQVADDGTLRLINPLAGKTGKGNDTGLDLALTADERFLYALNSDTGISGFRNSGGGTLQALSAQTLNLPFTAVGLIAR